MLLVPINLRVETLIQPSRCQLTAPVKTGVQNMYMKCTCTSPRISVIGCLIFLFAVVFRWSSYLATTKTKWIIKKPSNYDETGPGERTRKGIIV
ncbi:hypothetical protein EMCRGX_G017313 [Ephydatia muelleri]